MLALHWSIYSSALPVVLAQSTQQVPDFTSLYCLHELTKLKERKKICQYFNFRTVIISTPISLHDK